MHTRHLYDVDGHPPHAGISGPGGLACGAAAAKKHGPEHVMLPLPRRHRHGSVEALPRPNALAGRLLPPARQVSRSSDHDDMRSTSGHHT